MAKPRVGDAAISVLRRTDNPAMMWGDCDLLDWTAMEVNASWRDLHPLNRWQRVLDALDRDERFEKSFVCIDLWIGNSYKKRLVRRFALKES